MCDSVYAYPVLVQYTKVREELIKPANVEGINVYHFLRDTICQCVSNLKISRFHVFDVITICDINVAIEYCARGAGKILRHSSKVSKCKP